MTKKKICLIGGFAVGKTSLVRRYVSGIFSDDYLTTVGVKIDKRPESIDGDEALLMIWDLAGRDEFAAVQKSYLRGAEGFLYVADGTRKETLKDAEEEIALIDGTHPDAVSILLINKHDLTREWEIEEGDLEPFKERGMKVFFTSAKTGENVESAFRDLAARLLGAGENDS